MLYLCMSVAGSIPVIICFIMWLVQKQSYDFRLGKRLLLLGMFFYLVPFQMVKYILPEWTVPILKLPMDIHVQQNFYKVVEIKSVFSPDDSLWIPKWVSAALAVWLCIVVVFAVYQIIKYRIDIRRLLSQSERKTVDVDGEMVELLVNQNIRTPYTVGFFKQSVIVPEMSLAHPCFRMFYEHENRHRKNHDSLMKLICVIIICIHWFNPIAILLLFLYSVTAEYVCDAQAVEGCAEEQKKEYAQILIELSTANESLSMVWRNNLSGSEKLMRRRICCLMKRNGLMKKGIAVLATVLTVFVSASTILAYEPFTSADEYTVDMVSEGEVWTVFEEDVQCDCDFSVSDMVVVYEDGTQVTVSDEEDSSYALCNHTMKSCYCHVHSSNSTGGCTVKVYNAQQCTKCGYLKLGSLSSTHTYAVCPH